MTRKEAERQTRQAERLQGMGFTGHEAEQLRRISMTLQRWHELECGTGEGQVSRSVERDEETGRPFMRVQFRGTDQRYPIADREAGARRRLARILQRRNAHADWCAVVAPLVPGRVAERGPCNCDRPEPMQAYVQTDPRGCALYILPASVTEPDRMYSSAGMGVW